MVLTRIVKRSQLESSLKKVEAEAQEIVNKIEEVDTQLSQILPKAAEVAEKISNNAEQYKNLVSTISSFLAGADNLNAENAVYFTRESQLRIYDEDATVQKLLEEISQVFGGAKGLELAAKYYQNKKVNPNDDIVQKIVKREADWIISDLYALIENKFKYFKDQLVLDPKKLKETLSFEVVKQYMQILRLLKVTVDYVLLSLDEVAKYGMDISKYEEFKQALRNLQTKLALLDSLEIEYELLQKHYGILDSYNMMAKTATILRWLTGILDSSKKILEEAPSFERAYQGEVPKEILHENIYAILLSLYKQLATLPVIVAQYLRRIDAAKVDTETAKKIYMEEVEKIIKKRVEEKLLSRIYAAMLGEKREVKSFEEFERILLEKAKKDAKLARILDLSNYLTE